MAELSKNARIGVAAEKFFCTCGGEVKMKATFSNGKLRSVAQCVKCNRTERKPNDFKG